MKTQIFINVWNYKGNTIKKLIHCKNGHLFNDMGTEWHHDSSSSSYYKCVKCNAYGMGHISTGYGNDGVLVTDHRNREAAKEVVDLIKQPLELDDPQSLENLIVAVFDKYE